MTKRERQRIHTEVWRWRRDPTRPLSVAAREWVQQQWIQAALREQRAHCLPAGERVLLERAADATWGRRPA